MGVDEPEHEYILPIYLPAYLNTYDQYWYTRVYIISHQERIRRIEDALERAGIKMWELSSECLRRICTCIGVYLYM